MSLPRPKNSKAFGYLTLWLAALGLGITLMLSRLWPLGSLINGIVFWQSFVILHACGHRAFFKTPLLNSLTGRLMAPFCTLPFSVWKHLHEQHHKWSGWLDLDPTLNQTRTQRPRGVELIMELAWKAWIPIFSLAYMAQTFWNPNQIKLIHKRFRTEAIIDWFCLFLIMGILLSVWKTHFLKIWLPGYLVFLSLADLSVLCQHIYLPHELSEGRNVRPYTFEQQEKYARELRAPRWIENWVFGNFNRHASHHMWPKLAPYDAGSIEGSRIHEASAWQWLLKAKSMSVIELLQENKVER
ncbi:MAG: fatty acid desaturase [Bacteriovoracaceae bacterium]|nr:fatty acid desaturase [Bacteriovoracaceae bacterium]